MLAASYIFQKGTPFIYQGQEIGMTNIRLGSIENYNDVSSKTNFYRYNLKEELSKRLKRIHISSRDSSRTPMQWNSHRFAGFSKVKPWFFINKNYKKANVAAEEKDPYSILNFYKKCLELRKHSKALIYGKYREFYPRNPEIYMYERVYNNIRYLIICSFSRFPLSIGLPQLYRNKKGQLLLDNYPARLKELFRPYEARVYRFSF